MKVGYEGLNLRIIKKIGTIRARRSRMAYSSLISLNKKKWRSILLMPQHGSRSRAQRKEKKKNLRALSLPASPSIRSAERRIFPPTSVAPFVPSAPFLQTAAGSGTLSENEKAPPPPSEFSPVTIGSLARGTNSGLHDAGPYLAPPPYGDPSVFLDPSCDLPSPTFSPTPLSGYRHGL